jgi:undecaprenyl diphosphate synthase
MIDSQVPDMHQRGARVRFIGRRRGVPEKLARRIEEAEALTAANTRMTLYIAFNYGGRGELLDAAAGLAAEAADGGEVSHCDFGDEDLRRHLYAPEMHDPELLIRTSGEQRISNFLLWQCAYSELYFTDKLWPDFDEAEFDVALAEYARRQRRFGGRAGESAGEAEAS